jgi:pimeloyl-ACP methyl ester carboxylesterase
MDQQSNLANEFSKLNSPNTLKLINKNTRIILKMLVICFFSFVTYGQTGKVQANGITIAYESFGSTKNETILLVSGTNAQLTMWPIEFCEKLVENGFRVIRFDNRDIGHSTKFDNAGLPDWAAISKALQEKSESPLPYSLDDMADDAVALLDALGINKAHIIGASMGGMIAQRIAYNHPQHTLSLASIMAGGGNVTFPLVAKPDIMSKIPPPSVASDTTAYIEREVQSQKILSGTRHKPNTQYLLNRIKADVERSYYPDGILRQSAASLAGFYAGRQEKLKTIKVRSVIIHGDEDPLVAIDAGKDVAANIPISKFEIIEGMGHCISAPFYDSLINIIVENIKMK